MKLVKYGHVQYVCMYVCMYVCTYIRTETFVKDDFGKPIIKCTVFSSIDFLLRNELRKNLYKFSLRG